MRLYLVRHGEAQPKDVDPDRPLTTEGEQDARKMAAFLATLGVRPVAVWHSPKTRAAQTAAAMADALSPADGIAEHEGLKATDDVAVIGRAIEDIGRDLMLVGHLPHLDRLASDLLAGDAGLEMFDFDPGGAMCLELDDEGEWQLEWLIAPALLPVKSA